MSHAVAPCEPWSDADFLPVEVILRARPHGGPPTGQRLGVIRSAARGMYDARDLSEVSPERLRRFFLRGRGTGRGTFRVAPEIRRLVTFQHLDLRKPDWPLPECPGWTG